MTPLVILTYEVTDDPCAGCGGKIGEREVYEQIVNVTGYIRVPFAHAESCDKFQGNSMQPTSSEILSGRRDNKAGQAEGGSGVHKTAAGDPEPRKRKRPYREKRREQLRQKHQAEAQSRKIADVSKKVRFSSV
jgi:hypothetical protein